MEDLTHTFQKIILNRMELSTTTLSPVISIIVGILILVFPKFLNYFIAFYLIFVGLVGLGLLG